MRLLPLVAATYFIVSGGPYGLEDIIGMAGYGQALLLLVLVPVFWSLPTSLMVGELASAIPEEGGFYVWVTRALGRFWGFQEAWLSLAASVFDMAIYPTTFVLYLSHLAPSFTAGHRGLAMKVAIVLIATLVESARGEGCWGRLYGDDVRITLAVCRACRMCTLASYIWRCRSARSSCVNGHTRYWWGGQCGDVELHGLG